LGRNVPQPRSDRDDAVRLRNNVELHATNGVNLNTAGPHVLEALAKYRFRDISCTIDGASQETYAIYRRYGRFDPVIRHIETINNFKKKYRCECPHLKWKFIVFGYNEHEQMAKDLNMTFYVKLAWENLYSEEIFSPVKDRETVREESGLLVADRQEFKKTFRREYVLRDCCLELWRTPQINFDGRVSGCAVNYWGDYGNILEEGLMEAINNEKMNYARDMLMGKEPPRPEIPCVQCKYFWAMNKERDWIRPSEVEAYYIPERRVRLKLFSFNHKGTNYLYRRARSVKRWTRQSLPLLHPNGKNCLNSGVYRLDLPLPVSAKEWEPFPIFKGSTSTLALLSCHISSLKKNYFPHPPHQHDEEEILIPLFGEVDVFLPDDELKRRRLRRGSFVFYHDNFTHTIRTAGECPANYLLFKWKNPTKRSDGCLPFGHFNLVEQEELFKERRKFNAKITFEAATAYLKRLHCHVSLLQPKAGYRPHKDPYDVVIVIFDGEVETLGERAGPDSVIFYRSGQRHGMYNPGDVAARYLVFEFHGR
jgi:hypothetical protein